MVTLLEYWLLLLLWMALCFGVVVGFIFCLPPLAVASSRVLFEEGQRMLEKSMMGGVGWSTPLQIDLSIHSYRIMSILVGGTVPYFHFLVYLFFLPFIRVFVFALRNLKFCVVVQTSNFKKKRKLLLPMSKASTNHTTNNSNPITNDGSGGALIGIYNSEDRKLMVLKRLWSLRNKWSQSNPRNR